jgi:L-rhamnose isomerase
MIVSITSDEFDLDGAILLDVLPESNFGEVRRRVNRIRTIDGGIAVNDFGAWEGDRSITLRWVPTDIDKEIAVAKLTRIHNKIKISVDGQIYLAIPEAYQKSATESRLFVLVIDKLN